MTREKSSDFNKETTTNDFTENIFEKHTKMKSTCLSIGKWNWGGKA